MQSEAASKYPNETGGVLLGYADSGFETIVVTLATGPGPNAIHTPTRFVPDHEFHVAEVARIYASSGRRLTYIGDWHCHPKASAYLSAADALTLERIAGSPDARIPSPVMVVLGGMGQSARTQEDGSGKHAWHIEAWLFLRARSPWAKFLGSPPTNAHVLRCRVAGFEFGEMA